VVKPDRLRKTKWYRAVVDGLTRRGYRPANEVESFRRRVFKHPTLSITVALHSRHQIILTVRGVTRPPVVAENLRELWLRVDASELDAEFNQD